MTENIDDPTNRPIPGGEEPADEGINLFWWLAFFVSLGLWYGLFDAAIWAVRQIAG
jgi:hypothetical protein